MDEDSSPYRKVGYRVSSDETGFYATREKTNVYALCVGMQTAEGYWTVTNGARRPVMAQLSRPSLRIEICVVYFIGRSPTQLVLCHNSIMNASYLTRNIIQ